MHSVVTKHRRRNCCSATYLAFFRVEYIQFVTALSDGQNRESNRGGAGWPANKTLQTKSWMSSRISGNRRTPPCASSFILANIRLSVRKQLVDSCDIHKQLVYWHEWPCYINPRNKAEALSNATALLFTYAVATAYLLSNGPHRPIIIITIIILIMWRQFLWCSNRTTDSRAPYKPQ